MSGDCIRGQNSLADHVPALTASGHGTPSVSPSPALAIGIPLFLIVAAFAVMPLDVVISRVCYKQADNRPKWLRKILDNTEPFGHSVGVFIVAAAVFSLDVQRRRAGFMILSAGLGSGLLAATLKLGVGRMRPRNFDFLTDDVLATFQSWLPLLSSRSSLQSLPSAHAATAVGLAVALASLYPRGRVLFYGLTLFVAGHRLHSGAHFPSDILFGAAVGWIFGMFCLGFGRRWESALSRRSRADSHEITSRVL